MRARASNVFRKSPTRSAPRSPRRSSFVPPAAATVARDPPAPESTRGKARQKPWDRDLPDSSILSRRGVPGLAVSDRWDVSPSDRLPAISPTATTPQQSPPAAGGTLRTYGCSPVYCVTGATPTGSVDRFPRRCVRSSILRDVRRDRASPLSCPARTLRVMRARMPASRGAQPAGGNVGTVTASREALLAPPTPEPDEGREPALGEHCRPRTVSRRW